MNHTKTPPSKRISKSTQYKRGSRYVRTVDVEPEAILSALLALFGIGIFIFSMISGNFMLFLVGLLVSPSTILGIACVWSAAKRGAAIPAYVRAVIWILTFLIAFFSIFLLGESIVAAALISIPVFPLFVLLLSLSGIVGLLVAPKK